MRTLKTIKTNSGYHFINDMILMTNGLLVTAYSNRWIKIWQLKNILSNNFEKVKCLSGHEYNWIAWYNGYFKCQICAKSGYYKDGAYYCA